MVAAEPDTFVTTMSSDGISEILIELLSRSSPYFRSLEIVHWRVLEYDMRNFVEFLSPDDEVNEDAVTSTMQPTQRDRMELRTKLTADDSDDDNADKGNTSECATSFESIT